MRVRAHAHCLAVVSERLFNVPVAVPLGDALYNETSNRVGGIS